MLTTYHDFFNLEMACSDLAKKVNLRMDFSQSRECMAC